MSEVAAEQPSAPDVILARLARLHPKTIDLDLSRMQRLLDALDNPEKRLPPVIHVAGTNGKGSTIAYLRAILEAAGLRAHVFTSPHLVRVNESFRLGRIGGGMLVTDEQLIAAFDHCERINAGQPITAFEFETAAAMHLFAENPADVVILEVGLGGRLDSTNVVEHPAACVITPISIDHTDFLGDTLLKIAGEKAGIIKAKAKVISAEQLPEAAAVIQRQSARQSAQLNSCGEEWHVGIEHGRLVYHDERGLLDLALPRLFGRHQIGNAGLAIATLRALDMFAIEPAAYEAGVLGAEWPARMQRLTTGRLLDHTPQGAELWLDGGHNAEGGRVVAAALADLEERVPRQLVLIAGMMGNKDATGFLANFAGLTRHVIVVPIANRPGAMSTDVLGDAARSLGMRVDVRADVPAALQALKLLAYEEPPRILITGSLYLSGQVLAANGTPPV